MCPAISYHAFLEKIAPYVVIVGSFARSEETVDSDIDCFLRSRPVENVDPEISNETFMPEILDLIRTHQLCWSSVLIGHVAVEQPGYPRMIEISSHYRIPHTAEPFYREIDGVRMMCAQDDRFCDYEDCFDSSLFDESICDLVIPHPLPAYEP